MRNNERAFLFDLNGTMIDDMNYHLDVWYEVITKDLGANLTKAEVQREMYGKNDEVLIRIFGEERFKAFDFDAITQAKELRYQEIYRPHLDLIPGLFTFLETAKQNGIKMAIGSAAPPMNVDFALDNLNIRHYFGAVVTGADVTRSKPHPEVFLKAAKLLDVEPTSCIVFEDAPKGVEAAVNAGMNCVVITTMHQEHEFKAYDNVLLFIKNYEDPRLATYLC
jgi:beta-phosphoglucomutase family hydrolase